MAEPRPARAAGALLCLLLATAAAAAEPPAFEARFEIWRNGNPVGEARSVQAVDGASWRMENGSEGTRGSARWLGFSEASHGAGDWRDGVPRPASFSQAVRTRLKDRDWSAAYDWSAGSLALDGGEGESRLPLEPGTQDPLSAGLRIRAGLAAGEDHWQFPLVARDEVEAAEFRASGEERIDTALGCLVTRRVEKVRAPESRRYTRTWYAKDLGWAPVKAEHGKTGGNHLETRITTLSVAGVAVTPGPACTAPG